MIDAMSFGGGVQSTGIMVMAGEGHIPMPKHWVFSDPQFESQATYAHMERCKEYLLKKGAKLDVVSAGNIRRDAYDFAARPPSGEPSGLKRYASIPMYVDKGGGVRAKEGVLPRQCTAEFKIEPIEKYHREVIMGLEPRQRAPKGVAVNVWIGISQDEERRVSFPGRWKKTVAVVGENFLGEPIEVEGKEWMPQPWLCKTYPLLGYTLFPDRSRQPDDRFEFCSGFDRQDVTDFLTKFWPWPVPRSACLCCPYRTNDEWRDLARPRPRRLRPGGRFRLYGARGLPRRAGPSR